MKRYDDDSLSSLPTPKGSAKVWPVTPDGLQMQVRTTGSRVFGYIKRNAKGNNQFFKFEKGHFAHPATADSMTFYQAKLELLRMRELDRAAEAAPKSPSIAVDDPMEYDPATTTFFKLLDIFMEREINIQPIDQSRKDRYKRNLTAHFLKRPIGNRKDIWGDLTCQQFTRGTYKPLFRETLFILQTEKDAESLKSARNAPSTIAFDVDRFARRMMEFAHEHKLLTLDAIPKVTEGLNSPRTDSRRLSIPEIQTLLAATSPEAVAAQQGQVGAMQTYDAVCLRLLLITGCRLDAMRVAKRRGRDLRYANWWTFPKEDVKRTKANKKKPIDLNVPITPFFEREIARLEEYSGKYDYLFVEKCADKRDEVQPFTESWTKHLVTEFKDQLKNKGRDRYKAHALRRTVSNVMRQLDAPDNVIHLAAGRKVRGIDATYLSDEMVYQVTLAFENYSAFLEACEVGKGQEWMDDINKERRESAQSRNQARRQRLKIAA